MKTLNINNYSLGEVFNRTLSWRWWYGGIVLMVIALGWHFPYAGLVVPVVMTAGMVGGLFRGRYVCGNICPRGSLLDTWLAPFAAARSVPAWMRTPWFRGTVMVGLMGFLAWRLSADYGSLEHWGRVFWQMCLLTTLVAIAMGLAFGERAWCAVCPMGTLQAAESRGRYPLQIADGCRECRLCEKACPMALPVMQYRETGELKHPDCIKCSRCATRCPAAALSWPD